MKTYNKNKIFSSTGSMSMMFHVHSCCYNRWICHLYKTSLYITTQRILGVSQIIDSNRFESIQVANRLIDSKLLNRFTETIHYFTSSMALLPENANKLIFIKYNKQYYNITSCLMYQDVCYVLCSSLFCSINYSNATLSYKF